MRNAVIDEKVKEILQRPYSRVLIPDEDGGFTAEILEFRGCFSEGDSTEEAYRNLEEAAFNWVKATLEQGTEVPQPSSTHGFQGKVALRLPKSLHRQAAKLANRDGVSLNQFIVSAVATRVGAEGAFDWVLQNRLEQSRIHFLEASSITPQWTAFSFRLAWSSVVRITANPLSTISMEIAEGESIWQKQSNTFLPTEKWLSSW